MLAPKGLLSPKPFQQTSKGTLAPLWSFEEKYIQAKPFHLTHCVYPTVAAVCQSALIERKNNKKKKTEIDRQWAEGAGRVLWLRVESSVLTSELQQRGTSALQFTFPVVRVCHLHSNVILVFLQCQREQSSERVVCYRIKPPDHSYHEHNRVYSERAQGRSEWMWQQIEPVSVLSKALDMSLCVCMNVSVLVFLESACLAVLTICVHIISDNYCLYLLCVSVLGRGEGAHKDSFDTA